MTTVLGWFICGVAGFLAATVMENDKDKLKAVGILVLGEIGIGIAMLGGM